MGPASAAAILVAGWLIGATGIGGVLVVPALSQFEAMDVQRAIAASALAFAFPGVAALWWLRGAAHAPGVRLTALVAGALPGAVLGALLVHHIEPRWLLAGLALLALGSGLRGLVPTPVAATASPAMPAATAALLGFAVGIGSALTGTGGPVLLVPLLLLLRQPLVATVAAAQAIQLPLALSASAAHWASGSLDLGLAALLGGLLLAGSVAGQWCASRMRVHWLQRLVSLLLLATGAWFAWRSLQ